MLLNVTLLKNTILFLAFGLLLSLASFIYPTLNTVAFFVILGLTLVLSLKKLEWGVYIVLAELFVGSFGQLFTYTVEGFALSLRIGLFIVLMAVWFAKSVNPKGFAQLKEFFATSIGKWYLALGGVLTLGFVHGLVRNDFGNVFLDFNNWLYFLYILPFWNVFTTQKDALRNSMSVLTGSVIIVSLVTIVFEWFFAHQVVGTIDILYTWVRDFRIGEITLFTSNFYRIFIQSQIWALFGFFILLPILGSRNDIQNKLIQLTAMLATITLVISFSRSLWLGWAAGIGIFFLVLLFVYREKLSCALTRALHAVLVLVGAAVFIVALINIPPVSDAGSFGLVVSDRLTGVEAAGSSRINLLEPLWSEIKASPVVGRGFGSTVTYQSVDPRVVAGTAGASGEYTTYAFEWSYLDMWLKIGLIGLMVYLGLLFELARSAWKKLQTRLPDGHVSDFTVPAGRQESQIYFGFFLALTSLLVTNAFTPYLNHPLGIGFVLLMTVTLLTHHEQLTEGS